MECVVLLRYEKLTAVIRRGWRGVGVRYWLGKYSSKRRKITGSLAGRQSVRGFKESFKSYD